MSSNLQELLTQLDLEQLEDNLFRGQSADLGGLSVFGGQVVGQALVAAQRTVAGEMAAHSLHAYFLRPGDIKHPIVYDVERVRDGRSFCTRRVVAIQHGVPIFEMGCSFQKPEQGVEHQAAMPDVPPPENLKTDWELRESIAAKVPEPMRKFILRRVAMEMRPIDPIDPFNPQPRPPVNYIWFRADGTLPDDPAQHRAVLAYASDFNLLGTSLLPHGLSFFRGNLRAASIDHALWFHRSFRADEWLLYCMDSTSACGGRGMNRGMIFSRDGQLVASCAQEGLIRLRQPGK